MADPVAEHIAALQDEDWAIREEAALALTTLKDARAVEPLVNSLRDGDHTVRQAAVQALMAIGSPAVPTLGRCLNEGPLSVQEEAAKILAVIGDTRVAEPLVGALASSDWIVRMHAAKALGRLHHPAALPKLLPLLQDSVKAVREEATATLVSFGDQAVPMLLQALADRAWLVRLHAVEALGRLRARDAVVPLVRILLHDRDAAVRADAAEALGEIGDPAAVDPLLAVLSDRPVRLAAVVALGNIRDGRCLPALTAIITGTDRTVEPWRLPSCGDGYDEDPEVLAAAVKAVGQIKDPTTIPLLVTALRNTVVREEVAAALAGHGGQAIPFLLQVLKAECDENIRYYVKGALAQAGWRPHRV